MNPIGKYKNIRHFCTSVWETVKNGYPARKLTVIGITGTDGKTTTTHLIYEILKRAGYKTAVVSTIGAFVSTGPSEEFQDTGFHTTTPDATVLQPFLTKLIDHGITHVVLETTSHGLDQHRVLGCNFKVGVLTNITHEHLDYHKTFEKYRRAKSKLFHRIKYAVLNIDDSSYNYFKNHTNHQAEITSYGLSKGANLFVTGTKNTGRKTTFAIHEKGKKYNLSTTLPGNYNISNILAAAGAARSLGVDWQTIQNAAKNFAGVAGRTEILKSTPFRTIIDFAHTPNALESLLKTLRQTTKGRIITVLGCAGQRDIAKRPMMGEISTRLSDISIFTAEDPRSENVNNIIDQMAKGSKLAGAHESQGANLSHLSGEILPTPRERQHLFVREPDRRKAIKLAIKIARKGDTIVICGKGHEKTMAFGKTEVPWSDQEETRKALKLVAKK